MAKAFHTEGMLDRVVGLGGHCCEAINPALTSQSGSTALGSRILNREYSQKDGREELFERERHSEPVAGWHSCDLACASLEGVASMPERR